MRARIGRALPRSADLKPAERGLLAAAFIALVVLLIIAAANALLGAGGGAGPGIREWASWAIGILVVLIVCLRPLRIGVRRRSFAFIAAGVTAYSAGNVLWTTWLSHL